MLSGVRKSRGSVVLGQSGPEGSLTPSLLPARGLVRGLKAVLYIADVVTDIVILILLREKTSYIPAHLTCSMSVGGGGRHVSLS